MTWWYAAEFDRRRMRRELTALSGESPLAASFWQALTRKGDQGELDFVRLQLADLAEESGRTVLAKMIRKWMTCVAPGKRKRRKRRR